MPEIRANGQKRCLGARAENGNTFPGRSGISGMADDLQKGLDEVLVAESSLSYIDGDAGQLIYHGYDIKDLAREASFEEVLYLLWNDELPTQAELDGFVEELSAEYTIRGGCRSRRSRTSSRRTSARWRRSGRRSRCSRPTTTRTRSPATSTPFAIRASASLRSSRRSSRPTTASATARTPWNPTRSSRTRQTSSTCSTARNPTTSQPRPSTWR